MFWTLTVSETEEIQVLSSVTDSVTEKFRKPIPVVLYICIGFSSVEVFPSPKFQL